MKPVIYPASQSLSVVHFATATFNRVVSFDNTNNSCYKKGVSTVVLGEHQRFSKVYYTGVLQKILSIV